MLKLSTTAVKELRIHLCQTSNQSQGVREFIQKNYVNIKKENPNFPILIRECSGVQPRVWARYVSHACQHFLGKHNWKTKVVHGQNLKSDKGCEQSQSLSGLSCKEVISVLEKLIAK